MPTAKLVILDQVNVQLKGVDPDTLQECQDQLTYHVPGYIHMAKYKLGWWDGKIRLMNKSGFTCFNLLEYILPTLSFHGYNIDIEDRCQWENTISAQMSFIDNQFLSEFVDKEGNPITLWKHQVDGVNAAIREGSGILELATGAGKSIICGIMARLWQVHGHVVIIVPNIDLAIQTQYEFQQRVGLDCGIWYGERKERKQTTIATWQSLDHFPELFNDVICVIVDECHQAKSSTINEMLTGPGANVPFRFGCTGTLPKEDLFRKQIEGSIGKHIHIVRSRELQDIGVLADAHIYQLRLDDESNLAWQRDSAFHVMWKDELDWFFDQPDRLVYMAETIKLVAEEQGNTLVLVQYREHGKKLAALIPGAISLDGRNKNRKDHYDKFNSGDNNILICTYGIASTGLDIPRIFNLVFIEPGKKFEKVMQTLGRGFRKAKDKTHLNVFDICGNGGMSKTHAAKRRTLYKEAKQTFQIIDVEYHNASIDC
jgi:superfamily II DNA or RNA helicase